MIVPILLLSATLTVVEAAGVFRSDACLNCTTTCSIIAPSGSSFPCYQGSPTDANKCYSTDPLISPSSTWVCDTCSTQGYPVYLQNDPVYKTMELWGPSGVNGQTKRGSDACLDCTDTCSIVPPSGSSFPCYQGAPDDANFCFNTDPLIQSTSTYACGTCSDQGYSAYLQNDPIYKNMQLWNTALSLKDSVPTKVCSCSADLCSIVPPAGSSFPCYQGTIEDTTFCYNTDPLVNPKSTWSCLSCADEGYPSYLQNDPLYKTMELWVSS